MAERTNVYKLVVEKHKGKVHLEVLDVDKRMMLKLLVRNEMGKLLRHDA
jgi:hypothetical protein